LLPFEYSFNLPTQAFVDDKNNVLVPSIDYIFGYHVFSPNNDWKSFLAYNNRDLQYFKNTYLGHEIIQQTLAADLNTFPSKKNNFNGKEIVAVSSYNVLTDKSDEQSLYKLTADNQLSIDNYFNLTTKNITVANTQPQNVVNFFPDPVHLTEGPNGDIWVSYLGSFDNFIAKFSGINVMLYKLNNGGGDISIGNSNLIADKKGGAWWYRNKNLSYIEGNSIKNIIQDFGGLHEGVDFQIDRDNKLWYLDEQSNKLVSLTTTGQKSEIDVSTAISDRPLKLIYDDLKETFWILMRNNKLLKVSKSVDVGVKPEEEKKPIIRKLSITKPTASSEINVTDGLRVSFALSEGAIMGACRVELLKLNGQLEKLLSKNFSSIGLKDFPFNIKSVPSGEYYLKLSGSAQPNLKDSVKIFVINNTLLAQNEQVGLFWRNSEANQGKELPINPIGTTADGTAKLLIRLKPTQENMSRSYRAEVRIVSTNELLNADFLGSVLPVGNNIELVTPNQLNHLGTVVTSNLTKIGDEFIFEYQAPTDFNHPTNKIDLSSEAIREVAANITIYTIRGEAIEIQSIRIRIARPPLMLAHGLGGVGGEEGTWVEFKHNNQLGGAVRFLDSPTFLEKRAVNLLPTASFDANSDVLLGKNESLIAESFDTMIKRMNDQGYACAKVDYVAHSMGGSVLRNTLEKPEYKNSKNYNQGYVNKFITICTPHQGSPLGDIVAEFSPYAIGNWSKFGVDIALLKESGFYDSKLELAVPAVQNLAIRPENGGIKFPKQSIRNHTIIGNYVNKFSSDSEALQSLNYDKETRGFDYLTIIYAYAALKKFKECNCTKEFDELSKIVEQNIEIKGSTWASLLNFITNGSFPSFNVVFPKKSFTAEFLTWQSNRVNSLAPSFVKNSDLIVSVESQSAGRFVTWPKSFTSSLENPYTVYDGITHNFAPFKAIKDSDVGNRVFDLLNKSKNSVHFASDIAASPIIATPISCSPADCNTSIIQAESFIKLYPNPTPDFFNIDLTEIPEFDTGHLIIVDESGNKIHEMGIDKSCCKNLQVPFSRSGIYNVIVKTNNQTFTKKIVINK
jgi:hypothetical protein